MTKNTDVFTTIGASNHSEEERQPHDYYATDPKALEILLEKESFVGPIWEPACGGGHLSEVLIKHGYDVLSTDLIDYGYGTGGIDFFKWTEPFNGDIITNPPYSQGAEFVIHALELIPEGRKVVMFLKVTFLEGKKRRELFDTKQLKTVYVFSGRMKCGKNGVFPKGSAIAYAWYIWEKGYNSDPVIKWL